jgi:hypothetical protein
MTAMPIALKPGFVSEAEASLKRPIPNHSTKGSKGYLGVIRYPIVTCQFANARAVDCGDRRKDVQINRTSEAVRAWPSRLFSPLPLAFGFTHGIPPQV